MKEYRIVCTRYTTWPDGSTRHYDSVAPWVSASQIPRYSVFRTKADAAKALREAATRAQKFDAETQKRLASGDKNAIGYTQTDFRVQSRTVTAWE